MHWIRDDSKNEIFRYFMCKKQKNQCKIWRLKKEKLSSECLQQATVTKLVFGGEISGLDITNRRIYIENINGQLYCDVLQNGVKAFLA